MLPDYPKVKAALSDLFNKRIDIVRRAKLGPFSQIPSSRLFEGLTLRLDRADGSTSESDMRHLEVSSKLERAFEEITLRDIVNVLDDSGEKMAEEQFKMWLRTIDQAATEVGNVGKMGTPDEFLDMMEKRTWDFDETGRPTGNDHMIGSEQSKMRVQEILEEIEATPSLSKRADQIMIRKQQEWHDREAARKLVE